jgi:bacterial/archaeal transporter family-2 protein
LSPIQSSTARPSIEGRPPATGELPQEVALQPDLSAAERSPELQLLFTLTAFVIGMALALQPVINASVAARAGHPLLGALISVVVTLAALLLAIVAMRVPLPGPRVVASIPPWLYVGGLIGAVFLFSSLYLAPKLGAAALVAFLVAGQLAAALIVDHFGWLGVPERSFSILRLLGALCLMTGVLLVRRF